MKKNLLLSVAAATILCSSFTVCAAPQYTSDGEVIDPEYYLEQNPDVANWTLGTSADALYKHYTMYGNEPGRNAIPYEGYPVLPANILPYQGTDAAAATQNAEPEQPAETTPEPATDTNYIYADEGVQYKFPSIRSKTYNYEPCEVTVSFKKTVVDGDINDYLPEYAEPYTLPGYEWKLINAHAFTSLVNTDILSPYHYLYYTACDWDDSISDWNSLWEDLDDYDQHIATFTALQNGKEYPNCQLFGSTYQGSSSFYALVPQGFDGNLYVGFKGGKLENGEMVPNEASPTILFSF